MSTGVLKRGFSSGVLGQRPPSTAQSSSLDPQRLSLVSGTSRGCAEWQTLEAQFFPQNDVWAPVAAREGGLAAFGSGRWRADGKCASVSRGTKVFCRSSEHLWHRFVERQSKERGKKSKLENGSERYTWSSTKSSVTDYFWRTSTIWGLIHYCANCYCSDNGIAVSLGAYFIMKPLFGRLEQMVCWNQMQVNLVLLF